MLILLAALPFILMGVIPEIKLLIGLLILFSIYSFFRQFFGDGIITLILTGAAGYYLLFKNFWITTGIWWLYLLMGTMAFSALGWTVITIMQLFRRRG